MERNLMALEDVNVPDDEEQEEFHSEVEDDY